MKNPVTHTLLKLAIWTGKKGWRKIQRQVVRLKLFLQGSWKQQTYDVQIWNTETGKFRIHRERAENDEAIITSYREGMNSSDLYRGIWLDEELSDTKPGEGKTVVIVYNSKGKAIYVELPRTHA